MSEQSPKPHNGWFAVHEESLRTIERTFDREAAVRKATAAYVALLRISNLEGSCVFGRKINQIAKDMSYSYPHAAEALKLLEACGLCLIEQQKIPGTKELGPSKYTLVGTLPQKELTLEQNVTRLEPTRKSSQSPRYTNNSSKNEPRTYQEPPSSASPTVAGLAEKPCSSPVSPASRSARVKSLLPPSQAGLEFADWFRSTLPERFSLAESWREAWAARAFDALVRIDKHTTEEIWRVSNWARTDGFWAQKFLSPLKLRQRNKEGVTYFDVFSAQMNGSKARGKPSHESLI